MKRRNLGRTVSTYRSSATGLLRSGVFRATDDSGGIHPVHVLQFAVAHPGSATTLVGSANPDNIRRHIAYAGEPVDRELLARVLELLRPIHNHNFTRGRPENRDPVLP